MNFTDMTDQELAQLQSDAAKELGERQSRAALDRELEEVYKTARIGSVIDTPGPGDKWEQKRGGHDAYISGDIVSHNGKTYRSNITPNVWEPGDVSDPQYYRWWTELETDEDGGIVEPGDGGEWSGEGVEYAVGAIVSYDGVEYRAVQAHTSQPGWTPPGVPALWEIVEE